MKRSSNSVCVCFSEILQIDCLLYFALTILTNSRTITDTNLSS